jgi:hypothetical protein
MRPPAAIRYPPPVEAAPTDEDLMKLGRLVLAVAAIVAMVQMGTVPAGASTGSARVTAGASVNEALDPTPTVVSVTGGVGRPGQSTDVTLTGANLDLVTSVSASDGATASITTQTATSLVVHVTSAAGFKGSVDLTLDTSSGPSVPVPGAATFDDVAGEYVPIAPARLLDTRFGTGGRTGALATNETIDLQVAGVGGVPAADEVDSVVLNVTVTQPTGYGFLTVYPAGGARPNASNLNFVPGQTVPNLVSAKLSADGKVSIFSSAGTHVIADVVGYFSSAAGQAGARLFPITPTRIYDSRSDVPFLAANKVDQVCGGADVEPPGIDSVAGVVLNVTAVNADQAGWVTIWTAGQPMPPTSNLNVTGAAAVPNMVVVQPDPNGCVSVNTSIHAVDLIFDVSGVFVGADQFAGPAFTGRSPTRVLDTRSGIGAPAQPVTPYQQLTLSLAGQIPADAKAVLLNVTATQPTQSGYVTVWPANQATPLASSLNFVPGQTVPNLVLVPVSPDGKVKLMASGGTHLIADLAGYFS